MNIVIDVILHVNMVYYSRTPYIICTFFAKFIYNDYIRPFFLLHVVSMIFANDLPVGKWFGIDYLLDLLYIGKH